MDGWVWSNGGMVLIGENWSAGRRTLYSVGGRWMDECGAMVEWYWQRKPEVLGDKHYTVWVVGGWMSVEQWWNDTDRGKLKYWEKNISQYHSVQNKSEKHCPVIEPVTPRLYAGEWPPEPSLWRPFQPEFSLQFHMSHPTSRVTSYLTVNTCLPHFKYKVVKSPWKVMSFTARATSSGQCGHRAVSERYSRQHCSGVGAPTARCLSHSRTF